MRRVPSSSMRSTRKAPRATTKIHTASSEGWKLMTPKGIQRREPRVTGPRTKTAAMLNTAKPQRNHCQRR